jgi:hypothetical protein
MIWLNISLNNFISDFGIWNIKRCKIIGLFYELTNKW